MYSLVARRFQAKRYHLSHSTYQFTYSYLSIQQYRLLHVYRNLTRNNETFNNIQSTHHLSEDLQCMIRNSLIYQYGSNYNNWWDQCQRILGILPTLPVSHPYYLLKTHQASLCSIKERIAPFIYEYNQGKRTVTGNNICISGAQGVGKSNLMHTCGIIFSVTTSNVDPFYLEIKEDTNNSIPQMFKECYDRSTTLKFDEITSTHTMKSFEESPSQYAFAKYISSGRYPLLMLDDIEKCYKGTEPSAVADIWKGIRDLGSHRGFLGIIGGSAALLPQLILARNFEQIQKYGFKLFLVI